MAEMESLRSVYLELGPDHELWESIGTLLTEALTGNGRTNFLAVLGDADELVMEDFITTVADLEGYFKSTLFLVGVGISDSHMNTWFNARQGFHGDTGEEL